MILNKFLIVNAVCTYQVYSETDNFVSSITLGDMDSQLRGHYPRSIICYGDYKGDIDTFVYKFTNETNQTASTIKHSLKEFPIKLEKSISTYGERAAYNLHKIIIIFVGFRQKMERLMREKKFDEAANHLITTKEEMQRYDKKFFSLMKRLKKEGVEAAEKAKEAEKKYNEVRDKAKKEGKEIFRNYRMCTKRGDNP